MDISNLFIYDNEITLIEIFYKLDHQGIMKC